MKNQVLVISLLICNLIQAQTVYPLFKIISIQRGVGVNEIEFFSDSTFIESGRFGLVVSCIDKGNFEQRGDTLFFTRTHPRIINYTQIVENSGHYDFRGDTLFIIDSLSFCRKKNCLSPDYKTIEKRFESGNFHKVYSWKTKIGIVRVEEVNHGVNDMYFAQGSWMEYYPSGKLKRVVQYHDGLKNGIEMHFNHWGKVILKGEWFNSEKVGQWLYSDNMGGFISEKHKRMKAKNRHL